MLQHYRMWARSCHYGLKERPCFMTFSTVTNLGTLDMVHFIRGRQTQKPTAFLSASSPSSRWLRHMAHRAVGLSIFSNWRNKSIVERNRPLCQNAHKEAWTGKSSIFTSWEIITPFWMCLWGQRGLCYDACTIYWGRSIQCSGSEPWTLAERACQKWHCAFVVPKPHTRFLLCVYHGERGLSFTRAECKINLVSHLKDDIYVTTHKNKSSRIVSLQSHSFRVVGVLHMCFVSNHKSQAYVSKKKKKIIYSRTCLCKVCSKKEYLSLGTDLLFGQGKREESWWELSPAPLWLQHHPAKSSFWLKPSSGPRSLDNTQHAINSRQHRTHVSVRAQGFTSPHWM